MPVRKKRCNTARLYAIGVHVGLAEIENVSYGEWPDDLNRAYVWVACYAEARNQFVEIVQERLWAMGIRVSSVDQVEIVSEAKLVSPQSVVDELAARADQTRQLEVDLDLSTRQAGEE